MQALFVGIGPSFKNGYIMPQSRHLNNVDLYSLFSKLINITPSVHNGTVANILPFLK